jgi:hypothetical protein
MLSTAYAGDREGFLYLNARVRFCSIQPQWADVLHTVHAAFAPSRFHPISAEVLVFKFPKQLATHPDHRVGNSELRSRAGSSQAKMESESDMITTIAA